MLRNVIALNECYELKKNLFCVVHKFRLRIPLLPLFDIVYKNMMQHESKYFFRLKDTKYQTTEIHSVE